MRIVSWNINALKAHEQAFRKAFNILKPDIFCLQETRVKEGQVSISFDGYKSYWNSADLHQYYGTAVYMRNEFHPLSIEFDWPLGDYGYQGRLMVIEFRNFYLVNSYWPFSAYSKDGYWLKYRLEWTEELEYRLKQLRKLNPSIIVCGDMNIVRRPEDAFDGKHIKRQGCFYPEEHASFEHFMEYSYLTDAYRALHPAPVLPSERGIYTTWSYSRDDVNRKNNQGFRIDYFLVEERTMGRVRDCLICDDITGSDHCPIVLDIDISI